MHFYKLIKDLSKNEKILLYVDMDGVIASYNFGYPLDFINKRPLYTNINTLSKISELSNVSLHILSICKTDEQIRHKNDWLDKYASFFEKDKRVIISKESNPGVESDQLKLNYLKSIDKDEKIVFIDDDNGILKTVHANMKNIILYQDSELVD